MRGGNWMDNSALIKYYDPRTGKYEYATVLDVGDLSKLNTSIKTDLVSAINSIQDSDWGKLPPETIEDLENIKDAIGSIKDGTFIIEEWGSFDQYFQIGIEDAIKQLNIFNREQIVIAVEDIEAAIQESKNYYDQHLAETMQNVESARTDMANAQQTLNETAQRLEEADLNYSEVTLKVNEIDQYIEGNIKSVKFDIVNAVTTEYESLVRQMKDEFGVNVEESFLSYLTGRVGKAETDISVQSGKIESKVGYDEFQYMPVEDIDQYNKNLLFHTMDFSEDWERNDVRAYITTDSFRHTRIIAMDISNAYYSSITDVLELGKTYTLSASFNIQPTTKAPNEDKFAPTDGNYDVSAFIDGIEYPMVDLVENLTGVNGFKRLSVSFVSENENPKVYFRIKNLNAETSTGYMTAPKLESGNKSTPWQPHFDDEYATMLSTNSLVRQQGNEIVSLISSNKELGDKFVTATSSFQQLEEGFIRNAELIEEYEDAVVRYGMEVEELNDRITQKVWIDDFSDAVESISIDGKNRVLNSDFVDMSTDNNKLVLSGWENVDPLFTIEKINGINYAVIKRTGLTGNIVASMASNRFAVKNGERLMFGFDIIVEAMPDVGNVFQIELLDINDIRVGLESFTLDQMDGDITLGEVSRLNYQYIINREDVAKARVRLMLTRNGHVKFTRVMAQQGTIKDTEWSPAPEDAQILRMKMQTEINQTAEKIQLLANDERLDAINDILYRKEGKLEVSPSEILARVTSAELGDNAVVTGTQLKLTEAGLRVDLVNKEGIIQTINASDEGLKIDFDRVEVNGLLLAQIISTQYLDVSKGFKIMHGPNMILGIHPQTGEVTMNIPKLTINAIPALTEEHIPDIEKNVADDLESKIKPYVHVAYADSSDGKIGFTFEEGNKAYMGVYSDYQSEPSISPNRYLWSRIKGDETFTAYAINPQGEGFSLSPFDGAIYIGFFTGVAASQKPSDYEWFKAKGEDSFKVEVHSSNGSTFKNGVIDTWIYAVVYEGHVDVTEQINLARFKWERTSSDPVKDKQWNDAHAGGVKEFRVTKDDIYQRATFSCEILE